MLENPPDDRTDACGVSDALPSEGLPGRDESLKSDPGNGNRSSREWFGTKPSTGLDNMILKRGTATLFHAQTRKFTTVVHQAPTVHARSSHHGQGLNSRTQNEHTKRHPCTQPIAPANAA